MRLNHLVTLCMFITLTITQAFGQAVYQVVNVTKELYSFETWHIRPAKDSFGYILEKKDALSEATLSLEKDIFWNSVTFVAGADNYVRQGYNKHPSDLDAGERGFGFIEIRRHKDDDLLFSWPVFFAVERKNNHLRATFKIFIDGEEQNAGVVIITRDYDKDEYPFPFAEDKKRYNKEQKLMNHINYTRVK